jgi:hypothetical protein
MLVLPRVGQTAPDPAPAGRGRAVGGRACRGRRLDAERRASGPAQHRKLVVYRADGRRLSGVVEMMTVHP